MCRRFLSDAACVSLVLQIGDDDVYTDDELFADVYVYEFDQIRRCKLGHESSSLTSFLRYIIRD